MQDYRGTLLHVFLITLASAAACGTPRIVARVLRPGDWNDESTPHFLHDVLSAVRVPVAAGLVLLLLSLGVIRGLPATPTFGLRSARAIRGVGQPSRFAPLASGPMRILPRRASNRRRRRPSAVTLGQATRPAHG